MGLRNRSAFTSDNCFFVTTTCVDHIPIIHHAGAYSLLSESMAFVNNKYQVDTLGYVWMPNHIHFIVYFRDKNMISSYMRDFKKFTSTRIRMLLEQKGYVALVERIRIFLPNRTFQVWNNRFDDRVIRSRKALISILDYIHTNPLQGHWNLVVRPEDYPHSSAGFYELGKNSGLSVTHYLDYF